MLIDIKGVMRTIAILVAASGQVQPAAATVAPGGRMPVELGEAAVLPGTWLGLGDPFTTCSGTFTLAIRADLSDPGAVIADAGGAMQTLTLKGRYHEDVGRFLLEPTGWRGLPGTEPFRLELTYLGTFDQLVITQVGAGRSCEMLVAGRLDALPLPLNTEGLVFRAPARPNAVKETQKAVGEEGCLSYLEWFAARDGHILSDPEGMVRVLGVDLLRWEDDHTLRYRNLVKACSALLRAKAKGSLDMGLTTLMKQYGNKIAGVVAPLGKPPSARGADRLYAKALAQLNVPMLRELLMNLRLLEEGALGPDGPAAPSPALDPGGLLFSGYYGVEGFVPLRLTVDHCRRFYAWASDYEGYMIRYDQVYGGLFDTARMVGVFGKPLETWTETDGRIVSDVWRTACPAIVATDEEASALRRKAEEGGLRYGWQALETPPSTGTGAIIWAKVFALMADVTSNSADVMARVAAIESSDPTLSLVARLDEQLAAITPPRGPAAPYLTESERAGLSARLAAARVKAGIALAREALDRVATYPGDVDSVRKAQAEVDQMAGVLASRALGEGRNALLSGWAGAARERVSTLWPEFAAEAKRSMQTLAEGASSDFLQWHVLAGQAETTAFLSQYADLDAASSTGLTPTELAQLRSTTANTLLARSAARLRDWAAALQPSAAANSALDEFEAAIASSGADLASQPELADTIARTRAAYNPLGLARPDIAGALIRRHHSEVSLRGLEDIAYLTTIMRRISDACPDRLQSAVGGIGAARVTDFVSRLASRALRSAVSEGPRNQTEGMRMVMLFFHNLANQPGCRVDYYGNVIGCVSEEEYFAGQEYILSSSDGGNDGERLLREGCSGAPLGGFLSGLADHVAGGAGAAPLNVRSFEAVLSE